MVRSVVKRGGGRWRCVHAQGTPPCRRPSCATVNRLVRLQSRCRVLEAGGPESYRDVLCGSSRGHRREEVTLWKGLLLFSGGRRGTQAIF